MSGREGLGVDVVELRAFRAQLDDRASRFMEATFTEGERRDARSRPSGDPARHLAARFAAKEALVKAWSSLRWGQPPSLGRVELREVEVVCDAWGRPALRFHGALGRHLRGASAMVSLSHDGDCAIAVVTLRLP